MGLSTVLAWRWETALNPGNPPGPRLHQSWSRLGEAEALISGSEGEEGRAPPDALRTHRGPIRVGSPRLPGRWRDLAALSEPGSQLPQVAGAGMGSASPGWHSHCCSSHPSWGCALTTCQVGDRAGPRLGPCSVTARWTRDTLERSGCPPRVRHGPGRSSPRLLPPITVFLAVITHSLE